MLGGSGYAIYLAVENERTTRSNGSTDIVGALRQGWTGFWQLILLFQVFIRVIVVLSLSNYQSVLTTIIIDKF